MSAVPAHTGEGLALDLINTQPMSASGRVDLLATPDDLKRWLRAEAEALGDLTEEDLEALTEADVRTVQSVREHARAAIDAVTRRAPPPRAALEGLNGALHAAPAVAELRHEGDVVRQVVRREGPLAARIAAELAQSVAGLLTGPDLEKVRKCAAHDCVALFIARSPKRVWCSAARCGNRNRVARYYHRHKSKGAQPI